ncbi:LOW QUALITY PROTEIN: afamin-like [Rhynchocyon petersi]
MKQLRLAGFVIFLFFLTESLTLPTNPQDVDNSQVTQKYIEDNVGPLTIITVAQYLQEATFEEVEMVVGKMIEVRDTCVADMTQPECAKVANDVLQEKICDIEELAVKYNVFSCCVRRDIGGRNRCFLDNKKADVSFLPPLDTRDPEKKCQEYQQNRDHFLNIYLYEVAKRNPFVFAPTLITVAHRFEDVAKSCCEEQDKASCFRTKSVFMNNICTNQGSIASKSKECCEKTIPEHEECIIFLANDEKPDHLSFTKAKYIDSDDEEKFNETTEKSIKIGESFQNLGKDDLKYHFSYLIKLTKMAPQLSTEELIMLSEDFTTALDRCCPQKYQFACVDNAMDLVLGELCGGITNRSINHGVDQCCKSRFAFRRHCFADLKDDGTFLAPAAIPGLFIFHADLCQVDSKEVNRKKDRFLVDLMKLKPQLPKEELLSLLPAFAHVVEKCCKAAGREACFSEEGSKVEAKIQAA